MIHHHTVRGLMFTITLGQWGQDVAQANIALSSVCRGIEALPYAELVKMHRELAEGWSSYHQDDALRIEHDAHLAAFEGVANPPDDSSHFLMLGAKR